MPATAVAANVNRSTIDPVLTTVTAVNIDITDLLEWFKLKIDWTQQ